MKATTHDRRCRVAWAWPAPPLRVVLVEPEIPPNTGAIARLCAATGSTLELVGPLGFRLTDARLRRAGVDYWDRVDLRRHATWAAFLATVAAPARLHLYSTGASRPYTAARHAPGDALVFGGEGRGLPTALLDDFAAQTYAIPVQPDRVRSLNLATATAIVLFAALHRLQPAPA